MNKYPMDTPEKFPQQEPRPLESAAPIPPPTYWPAALALGASFLLWGILTSWVMSAAGFILSALSLAGWVADLRKGKG